MNCPMNDDVLMQVAEGQDASLEPGIADHVDGCPVCSERMAEVAALEPFAGSYVLLRQLGKGGMGTVWKAKEIETERIVALKQLNPELVKSQESRDRFAAECTNVAAIEHPDVVRMYRTGVTEGGVPFYAMEYVDGRTLEEELAERPEGFDSREAAALVRTISLAIHAAHERGVIHRDIKPTNILITPTGHVKVTDFGISKRLGGALGKTLVGQEIGSGYFMAPEQVEGTPDKHGPTTDVFALGVVLYRLLTKRYPFEGATCESLYGRIRHAAPLPPRIAAPRTNRDLEAVCLKCLAKSQAERYQTALELAEDLECVIACKPVKAYRPSQLHRTGLLLKRNWVAATLVAAVVIILSIGTVAGWRSGKSSNNELARQHASKALDTTSEHLSKGDLAAAQATYEGAKGHFEACGDDEGMSARVSLAKRDLTTAAELGRLVRLSQTKCLHPHVASSLANEFDAVFRSYGINLQAAGEGEAKAAVEGSHIRPSLIRAAEMWASTICVAVETKETQAQRKRVTSLLNDLNGDPLVQTVRSAYYERKMEYLKSLADSPELHRLPTWLLIGVLQRLAESGGLISSMDFARKIEHLNSDDAVFRAALGDFYLNPPMQVSQVTCDDARIHYRAATEFDKTNAKYRLNYGRTLFELGEIEKAEREYRHACKLDDHCDLAFQHLGVLLMHDGRVKEAVKAFEGAVGAEPGNFDAWIELGYARQHEGRFADAIEAFASAEAIARRYHSGSKKMTCRLDCERIASWIPKVPAVTSGREAELGILYRGDCDLAFACSATGYVEKACEIYKECLKGSRSDGYGPQFKYTYAAGTAMQASLTASSEDAEKWRKQAYDWLRKGLALDPDNQGDAWKIPEEARELLLRHALNYAPLAITRKGSFQNKMSMGEAHDWRELWEDVFQLLRSPRSSRPIGGVGN